jgi:hypothetical protein
MSTKLKSVLLVAGLCLSAQATVIYQDNFTGTGGSLLNGRSPDTVNTGGATYTASDTLKLDGNGRAVSTNGSGSASIAMPTLTANDTVIMTAVLRPRNTVNNWMGFGFTDVAAGSLATDGIAWAYLRGGARSNQGQVTIASGDGTTGQLYTTAVPPEAGYAGLTDPSTLKITYAVSNGNMKVELGANTVWEGLIDYGGVADTPAPAAALDYFTFQWNAQFPDTNANPGYFDSITVEVIPEPATIGMLGLGAIVAALIRRFKI